MSLQKSLHCKSETSITLIQNRNFATDDYIIYFKPIYDNILRKSLVLGIGLVYGVKRHLQQYFSYIVVVSSIVGGKRRKPPTCRKSLTLYHIILYRVHLALSRFELTMLGEIIAQVVVNPTTIWSQPLHPLFYLKLRMNKICSCLAHPRNRYIVILLYTIIWICSKINTCIVGN